MAWSRAGSSVLLDYDFLLLFLAATNSYSTRHEANYSTYTALIYNKVVLDESLQKKGYLRAGSAAHL